MEIALRSLTELAVHVKLASEAVLAAARHVAELRPDEASTDADPWSQAMDDLVVMNVQLAFMERILRSVACDEVAMRPAPAVRGARLLTP
jgi:hypothetical protein